MKPTRVIVGILGSLVLLPILLPVAAGPTNIGAVLKTLPFGWWYFLKRNIPQLTLDWGLVGTGIICTMGVLVLGNWFMGALFRQLQPPQSGGKPTRKWRWAWSWGVYAAMWILFLIAFGAAGVLRHTTWLLNAREPWYEERLNAYTELRIAEGKLEQLMFEADQDLEKTRRAIVGERGYRNSRRPLCEDFNIILYGNHSNRVNGYLIVPRNPKLLAKGNFAAWTPDQPASILPLTQLRETMSRMEAEHPIK